MPVFPSTHQLSSYLYLPSFLNLLNQGRNIQVPINPVGKLIQSLLTQVFRKKKRPVAVVSRAEHLANQLPDASPFQRKVIEQVESTTMTSPERILALLEATQYIVDSGIEGDIVECGVWRGGSMAAVCRTLVHANVADRRIWMYDTYEGMSEPTEADVDFQGKTAGELMARESESQIDRSGKDSIWCDSSLESVQTTMRQTGYPYEQVEFVKGKVEETLPNCIPEKIALLRLDTDWYESTKCELEHLFPRLVQGGVLIIDDFGHWKGCRQAVEEYFEQHQIKMLLNRIDYTGRVGIKAFTTNALNSELSPNGMEVTTS